jgi:hypothetical protein
MSSKRSPTAAALAALDVPSRIARRAQTESMAFELSLGGVCVRNESYDDPAAHEYTVSISEGVPKSCTCPADEHYESACKHRVAVAINRPVLTAAMTGRERIPDGGETVETGQHSSPEEGTTNSPTDDCSCAAPGELPCWECVRTGRRELPDPE